MKCSYCWTDLEWRRDNPALAPRWVCVEPFCGAKNPRIDQKMLTLIE